MPCKFPTYLHFDDILDYKNSIFVVKDRYNKLAPRKKGRPRLLRHPLNLPMAIVFCYFSNKSRAYLHIGFGPTNILKGKQRHSSKKMVACSIEWL